MITDDADLAKIARIIKSSQNSPNIQFRNHYTCTLPYLTILKLIYGGFIQPWMVDVWFSEGAMFRIMVN